MKNRFMAWLACSPPERRLLGEAWLLLLGIWVALRFLSLPRVQALLCRVVPANSHKAPLAIDAERLAWLVGAAARRHFWSVSCLEKALTLETFLRRCNISPELRIGVRREGDVLQAHAWVEVQGHPVGEAPDVNHRFLPIREARTE